MSEQQEESRPREAQGAGGAAEASDGEGPAQAPASPEELGAEHLRAALEEARALAEERWQQLLRAQAELENARRRHEREMEKVQRYALERFVAELLPVKDSLELGLASALESSGADEKLREGVELTLKMLATVLEKFGVRELNPEGERFDPELHEAMATQEVAGVEPNTVLTVYQKGYQLHDRLIRPALVVVAAGPGGGQGGGKRVDERA